MEFLKKDDPITLAKYTDDKILKNYTNLTNLKEKIYGLLQLNKKSHYFEMILNTLK